jgi:hypothetical protein
MKNYQWEVEGLQELPQAEQKSVSGGIGLILLAAAGGLYTMYNLGKVFGTEFRHMLTD